MAISDSEFFRNKWEDYIDTHPEPIKAINQAILKIKGQKGSKPWLHPNSNIVWLWDWLLVRKSELLAMEEK